MLEVPVAVSTRYYPSTTMLLFVGPSNMPMNLRNGSAQTIVRVAVLRQKLQGELAAVSPSHSIVTPGKPVLGQTL